MKVKATKTERYAQHQPHLPQYLLMDGKTYDLPEKLARRVVDLEGGEPVEDDFSNSESEMEGQENVEDNAPNTEAKEKSDVLPRKTRGKK